LPIVSSRIIDIIRTFRIKLWAEIGQPDCLARLISAIQILFYGDVGVKVVCIHFPGYVNILGGIQHVKFRRILYTEICVKLNNWFSSLPFLGGDQDYAVCAPASVD